MAIRTSYRSSRGSATAAPTVRCLTPDQESNSSGGRQPPRPGIATVGSATGRAARRLTLVGLHGLVVPVEQAPKLDDLAGHGRRDQHPLLDNLHLHLPALELLFHGVAEFIDDVFGSRDAR